MHLDKPRRHPRDRQANSRSPPECIPSTPLRACLQVGATPLRVHVPGAGYAEDEFVGRATATRLKFTLKGNLSLMLTSLRAIFGSRTRFVFPSPATSTLRAVSALYLNVPHSRPALLPSSGRMMRRSLEQEQHHPTHRKPATRSFEESSR